MLTQGRAPPVGRTARAWRWRGGGQLRHTARMKASARQRTDLPRKLRVHGGSHIDMHNAAAGHTHGWSETRARAACAQLAGELGELQYRLYAEGRHGVLVVLQAIDGGGKDSTIRHVFSAFNPQGCTVRAFKVPSAEELRHDFLWRIHQHVPPRGEIAVFNRSHYEDVLVARVDGLVSKRVWHARYRQINEFERMLVENDIRVVKLFLHISRAEQRRRFEERIHDPRKQWKFDPQDLVKRAQWPAYRKVFGDMLGHCSTAHAPWYVVPSDHKWLRDLAVAQILAQTLRELAPRFPSPRFNPRRMRVR
ncbi:MAG: polyphosphate kinase 2 family protein [Proteobacteria bacterium]|nr:polyphosphate kinase 2 family protein [Pseudomonadota bacterium]